MKKLEDYRKDYEYFTSQASLINRSLALGGIGIIWIFKFTVDEQVSVPAPLIQPLLLFAISMTLDLLQYVSGGFIWWAYFKYHEKDNQGTEEELLAPSRLTYIIHAFYWLKITAMITGYIYLISYLLLL